jgi:WD40 repeat protein
LIEERMRTRTTLLSLLLTALFVCPAGPAQEVTASGEVVISPERLDLKPGDPLSARALVSRPRPMRGLVSWSLESRRHRGTFWCQALSPDGKTLATGGLDGTVRLWDVASGRLIRALIGHNSYVYGLDWSPDGQTLASAGAFDATVRLWNVKTGRPLRVLRGHPTYLVQVKWAPSGRTILGAGGDSGGLSHWDVVTGKKLGTVELGKPVLGLSWRPDGAGAAVVSQGLALQLWDAAKNKVLRMLGAGTDGFQAVAWSPDGKTLAASTAKDTRLYDGDSDAIRRTLPSPGNPLAWSRDSKHVFLLSGDVKVWDATAGTLLKTIATPGALAFAFTPDAAQVISGGSTVFSVHEASTGKSLRQFDIAGTVPAWWWPGRPLVAGVGTPSLSLWDPASGKQLRSLTGHAASVSTVAFSPDRKTLASASYDKTVRLWDVATGKVKRTFTSHGGYVLAVAFSATGKLVASGGADKEVLVWEAASGKVLHKLSGHDGDVAALAWAPGSSSILASAGKEGTVRLWTVRTGKATELRATNELVSLAWSPDGKWLAGGQGDHRLQIWQVSSGNLLHTLEEGGSPPQVSALAWSPNGRMLAAGRGNHTMQLWEPRSGKKLFSIPTMAPVQRVNWTPGSTTVVVSSHDRTTRFFDAATSLLRGVLLAEDKQILAVSADGYYRAPDAAAELVYVVQTYTSQDTYTTAEFAAKFKWKNLPAKVVLTGK